MTSFPLTPQFGSVRKYQLPRSTPFLERQRIGNRIAERLNGQDASLKAKVFLTSHGSNRFFYIALDDAEGPHARKLDEAEGDIRSELFDRYDHSGGLNAGAEFSYYWPLWNRFAGMATEQISACVRNGTLTTGKPKRLKPSVQLNA